MLIVDDLVADVDGSTEDLQCFFDDVNSPIYTGTEAARAGKKRFHRAVL